MVNKGVRWWCFLHPHPLPPNEKHPRVRDTGAQAAKASQEEEGNFCAFRIEGRGKDSEHISKRAQASHSSLAEVNSRLDSDGSMSCRRPALGEQGFNHSGPLSRTPSCSLASPPAPASIMPYGGGPPAVNSAHCSLRHQTLFKPLCLCTSCFLSSGCPLPPHPTLLSATWKTVSEGLKCAPTSKICPPAIDHCRLIITEARLPLVAQW